MSRFMGWIRGLDWIEVVLLGLGFVLGLLVGVMAWIVLSSPSCEERGGTSEFSHHIHIWQKIGNVQTVNLVPVYDCVGAK